MPRRRVALLLVALALAVLALGAGLVALAAPFDLPPRQGGNTLPIDDNHPYTDPVVPISGEDAR